MSDRTVAIGDEEFRVTVEKSGALYKVVHDGHSDAIEILRMTGGDAALRVNGQTLIVPYTVDRETIHFFHRGEAFTAEVSPQSHRKTHRHRDHSMSAPMPGAILEIFVRPGEVVSRGTPLLILEAMKMEHQITAPHDGTVKAILCSAGELVQPGVELIEFE